MGKNKIPNVGEWKDRRGKTRVYVSKKWPDGCRFRRRSPNKIVAKKVLSRIEESIVMGTWRELRDELTGRVDQRNPTIKEFCRTYLDLYCKRNRRPDFKAQAIKPIKRHLGGIRIKDFRRGDADEFIAKRSMDGVAPATVNRSLAVLKNMLGYAFDRGYIDSHPMFRFRLLPEEERALRILTVQEYRKLIKAVAGEDEVIGVYCAVLGETGIRKAEGLRLEWSDIDVHQARLTVRQSKSGKPRYIPLSAYALEWISKLERIVGIPHVFLRCARAWKDPRGPLDRGKEAAKLDWVKGFHDLRHFRATQWLIDGVDIRTIQELLGHAGVETTERYVHYLQDHATESLKEAERREQLRIAGGGKVED